jgi:ribosomal protein S18 acetylase RimI-like enzyme
MNAVAIKFADESECQELEAFLVERVYEFNAQATGYFDAKLIGASVQNESGEILAAMSGHTWGGCCEVTHLWVHAAHRGSGLGRALVETTEHEAMRRGCQQVVLSTHSFQSPAFYERLGFHRQAVVQGQPSGHSNIVYRKRLTGEDGI